jgi:hypothetical protein
MGFGIRMTHICVFFRNNQPEIRQINADITNEIELNDIKAAI